MNSPRRRPTMTPAERFFWKHAGFSYDPATETANDGRRRCAATLAEAEAWAATLLVDSEDAEPMLTFSWDWDDSPDLGDHDEWCADAARGDCDGSRHEVLVCIARYRDGSVAACLGGIIDADSSYRRVVEAELAAEARADALRLLAEAV